jgi:succinylglutamate desuccinylase
MQSIKKSCKEISPDILFGLMAKDFLQFSLTHSVEQSNFEQTLTNGTKVCLNANGILALYPQNVTISTKSIVLSCGVHGNETAPIEICNQLIHALLNEEIKTQHRLLFIFGNLASMEVAERFVEENLNRLFSRSLNSDSLEGDRAKAIMYQVDAFFDAAGDGCERIHYDLHTAIRPSKNEKFAVYPFLHGKAYSKTQLAFLSACDVNTILLSQSPTTTFSYYSSLHHDAHGFTVELGKVMPFGQNDMRKFTAIRTSLTALICENAPKIPDYAECPIEIYTVNQVINKHFDDFKLHFPDDTANFTGFSKGELFASETNTEYRAQYEGETIVFPNANVSIGQRALLTLIPYEL